MQGDHDWSRLISPTSIDSTLYNGRFAAYYLPYFLTGNNILPVLVNLYAFVGLALGGIALCVYWKVPKSIVSYSVIALLLAIQPYTLLWLWFSFETIPHLWAPLFVIAAYMLSEKVASSESRWKCVFYIIIAVIFFVYVLGIYPSVINTMAVVLIGRLIIDVFLEKELTIGRVKNIFLKHKYSFLSAILGGVIFKLILEWLAVSGKLNTSTYHIQTIALVDFPSHFLKIVGIAFNTLWDYPMAFFPQSLIHLFAIVFVFGIVIALLNIFVENKSIKQNILKSGLIIIGASLIIIFSKTAAIMSPINKAQNGSHILFFGDAFLHVFPIAFLFIQKFQFPKNIMIIVSIVLLNMCAIQDSLALKVWKFGYDAEKMLWNRIAVRIEESPAFKIDSKKPYNMFVIGVPPSYRPFYYFNQSLAGTSIVSGSFAGVHPDSISFYMPEHKILFIYRRYQLLLSKLKDNDKQTWEYILKCKDEINKAKVWPDKNSVIVKDDVIIMIFDQKVLETIKELIAKRESK
jgi:hypothetical protein